MPHLSSIVSIQSGLIGMMCMMMMVVIAAAVIAAVVVTVVVFFVVLRGRLMIGGRFQVVEYVLVDGVRVV